MARHRADSGRRAVWLSYMGGAPLVSTPIIELRNATSLAAEPCICTRFRGRCAALEPHSSVVLCGFVGKPGEPTKRRNRSDPFIGH
jgi:hypothetical protein